MTPTEDMERMTARIAQEALLAVRWEAMEAEVRVRLPELCDDAAEAAEWARLRVAYALEMAER
jgi:hypothetical protein